MSVPIARARLAVILLGLTGAALLSIGLATLLLLPSIIKAKLDENLVLAEGKELFNNWRKVPIPVLFSAWIFNITNPQEVLQGALPVVQETGPFVFEQLRRREVLSWDNENKTVTYKDMQQYHFVPSLSKNLSEKVYTVNIPFQGIITKAKEMNAFVRRLALPALRKLVDSYHEELFVYKSCEELLFKGYKVDLFEDLFDLLKPFVDITELLPDNRIGFLIGKNNSGDGIFTVHTGVGDSSKLGKIISVNNMSEVPYWNDPYCNMINGTDGTLFSSFVTKKDVLYAFNPGLCRSVFIDYASEEEVKGIPVLRFKASARMSSRNPDNKCFCFDKDNCEKNNGTMDLSPCREGLKFMLSGPHLFLANPFFKEKVGGLSPSAKLHEGYVDIEPTTGLILRASGKMQLNYLLEQFSGFWQTENLSLSSVPLIWIAEDVEVTEDIATRFKSEMFTPLNVAKCLVTSSVVVGVVWIVVAGFIALCCFPKEPKMCKSENNPYMTVSSEPEEVNTAESEKLDVMR